MREIKFRAWKPSEKRMIPWDELKEYVSLSDVLQGYWLIPMEYTGLKDKNGVEIHEGDVVCFTAMYEEVIATVQWDYQDAGYYYSGRDYFKPWRVDSVVVIGNIYENPELLK